MKRILLLTDFSRKSLDGLNYTRWLWQREPCVFYIMHAYGTVKYGLDAIDLLDPYEVYEQHTAQRCKDKMQELKKSIDGSSPNTLHSFRYIISEKNFTIAVSQAVDENNIEIIVMGADKTVSQKIKRLTTIVRDIPFFLVPKGVEKRLHYSKPVCKNSIVEIQGILKSGFPLVLHGYAEHQYNLLKINLERLYAAFSKPFWING